MYKKELLQWLGLVIAILTLSIALQGSPIAVAIGITTLVKAIVEFTEDEER